MFERPWREVWLFGLLSGFATFDAPDKRVVPQEVAASDARARERFLPSAESVRGQYIVGLEPEATAERDIQVVAQDLAERYRGQLNRTFRNALRGFAVQMTEADALALSREPGVAYVEEDCWKPGAPGAVSTGYRVERRATPS